MRAQKGKSVAVNTYLSSHQAAQIYLDCRPVIHHVAAQSHLNYGRVILNVAVWGSLIARDLGVSGVKDLLLSLNLAGFTSFRRTPAAM